MWGFGVGLFTALLLALTYMNRLAGYLGDGVPPALILEVFGLMIPPMLVKTFPMSMLLAALLGFGRLSSDSEIVALKASGASVFRIIVPVMAFASVVSIVSFAFGETIVPPTAKKLQQLTIDIAKTGKVKSSEPIGKFQIEKQKVTAFIAALAADVETRNVNGLTQIAQRLSRVTVIAFDKNEKPTGVLLCDQLVFAGPNNWEIRGSSTYQKLNLLAGEAPQVVRLKDGAWPQEISKIRGTYAELTAPRDDNFDASSMAEIAKIISKAKENQTAKPETIANWEYGYYNKVSTPLAALIFGALGAVLGIRNHRTGNAAGFALTIAIIFGYVSLSTLMNVWARKELIPPWASSFSPVIVGLVASAIIMWRRNYK